MSLQLQIEKLKDHQNYNRWAMIMKAYLESEDLWCAVEHGPGASKESKLKDKRAKLIILCHIDDKFFEFFEAMPHISTAQDLWYYFHDTIQN